MCTRVSPCEFSCFIYLGRLFFVVSETPSDHSAIFRKTLPPVEGIFYDGQIFDAYAHIVSLIKQARSAVCQRSHDRFLIVDDVVYIFGASLKDAGKKLFAYIKMQETSPADLLSNIR